MKADESRPETSPQSRERQEKTRMTKSELNKYRNVLEAKQVELVQL
jgi:hypothetical protein